MAIYHGSGSLTIICGLLWQYFGYPADNSRLMAYQQIFYMIQVLYYYIYPVTMATVG